MKFAASVLALAMFAPGLLAQQKGAPAAAPASTPAKRTPPQPAATTAPGGGPDKVWVNTSTSVYHCPGDRFYGKTKDGRYMTEKDARAAGGKGPRGKTCFK